MKKTLISLVISGLALLAFADERPNIILIMADDMGFSDIGCYGGEIETPNLDQLANDGVKFSQFYNSARCCPTRASLMTGLHPHQTGLGWMTNPPHKIDRTWGEKYPGYQGYMTRNCVTIAEVLGEAGYATLMTGKWHLGFHDPSRWPLQRGFEKFYGIIAGASNLFYPEYPRGITFGNDPVEDPESTTDRRYYVTDAFTDWGIKFIDEEKAAEDRPFFLYLAYTSPHWPLHAHREEVEKYRGKYMMGWDQLREERYNRMIELGLIDSDWAMSERSHLPWDEMSEEKKDEMDYRMAYYAAMVDRMDQNIGKLIDHLKAIGKYENTIIMFLSDNGACQEGGRLGGKTDPFDVETWERTYGNGPGYGEVWANASNTPFRKFKHYTHEGGIATPFILSWPEKNKKSDDWYQSPAYLPDVMATVVDISGASYPSEFGGNAIPEMEGISMAPALKGKALKRQEPMFWEHEYQAAIRVGDWKLVGSRVSVPGAPDESRWELYDLSKDRTEVNELSDEQPEKRAKLAKLWKEWANEVQVYPRPPKHTYPVETN